ncbi:hypothetical protein [Labrys wisconsinensis]|uniref:Uncharacterized protein n=1 Tax=Labrys wisconsinensis TaxID=425677 RepID=A0ABU0JKL6_9HYPH|nr:hypothetical protein [Labrys wisconsinensis]MDQ0474835.1 hypothetical protein [Labrys wisconsinensis]
MIPASYFFRDLYRRQWVDAPPEQPPAPKAAEPVPARKQPRPAATLTRLSDLLAGLFGGGPRPQARRL